MATVNNLGLFTALLLATVCWGQEHRRWSGAGDNGPGPVVKLGVPTVDRGPEGDYPRSAESTSFRRGPREPGEPELYTARQVELPPPGGDLPPPAYEPLSTRRNQGGLRPGEGSKHFTLDYVFLSPSNVRRPDTGSVTMNQIGFNFTGYLPITERWMLTYRPVFDVMFVAGPSGNEIDLPPQLYQIAIDLQFDFRLNDRLGLSVGITPGLWSDLQVVRGNDIRLPARVLATYRASETLFLAGGVFYSDNIYRNLYPAAGVIWDFDERWRLEILFPRSRIIYRFHDEIQFYLMAEQGGNTYNIRTLGVDEDMQYRDARVALGTQIDTWQRASLFFEVGATVNRRFRFDTQPHANVDNGLFLRAGARF